MHTYIYRYISMKRYKLIKNNTINNKSLDEPLDESIENMMSGGYYGKGSTITNPKWPPIEGQTITVKSPYYRETFIGKVHQNIWNNTSSVILLMNHRDYIEDTLKTYTSVPGNHGGRGLFLVLPTYEWKYINENTMYSTGLPGTMDMISVNNNVNGNFKNYMSKLNIHEDRPPSIYGDNVYNRSIGPVSNTHALDSTGLSGSNLLLKASHSYYSEDDDLRRAAHCKAGNPIRLRYPQKKDDFDNLFKEQDINMIMQKNKKNRKSISLSIKKELLKKIISFETPNPKETNIAVNEGISVNNYIDNKEDEMSEGGKMIQWVRNNFKKKVNNDLGSYLFDDIQVSIFNGYVYIARDGIEMGDNITEKLIPDLKYFKWQYNHDIDYHTLKYVLFQNQFQKSLKDDTNNQKEAEKMLAQEYLISIQPEPRYQMWCVKRILMCWYADPQLDEHIRKIKILINQWRANDYQQHNQVNGVLPSIVIYPKYGAESAKIVMSKLSYYFSLYKNMGWVCSNPSYFIKSNSLMYYTNGAIDLKLYYRNTMQNSNLSLSNTSFDRKFTHIEGSEAIIKPTNITNTTMDF